MTWRDRVENTIFSITTGDGVTYFPSLPIGYETTKEFNTATFEYINVEGSEIARRNVKARQFPLAFVFTGEDNIDQAEAFDLSCNDNRPWQVAHPMYGGIVGQPISVRRSDAQLNVTQFNVDFWETITDKPFAISYESPQQKITDTYDEYHELSPLDYESKVDLKAADITTVKTSADSINALIKKGLDAVNYTEYQQLINTAFTAIDSLTTQPIDAIRTIHDVIMAPSRFLISVDNRISLIVSLYNSIGAILAQVPSRNNKAYFETAAGVSIVSLATAMLNPLPTDYKTRLAVTNAADNLAGVYNDYLSIMDAAYVSINNPATSFSTSINTQNALQNAVFQTLIALQTIAFNAKIERRVLLTSDSQLIVLTHKYMGLASDENIETFRTINNIKNTNLFLVPAGTDIIYYS